MIYHYRCPQCRRWLSSDWQDRKQPRRCPHSDCQSVVGAPTPDADPAAWVDSHAVPDEMAKAACSVNGRRDATAAHLCSVPGCRRLAAELDHRVPFDWDAEPTSNRGKTCVENLFPICRECNASKAEHDYGWWLANVGAPARSS